MGVEIRWDEIEWGEVETLPPTPTPTPPLESKVKVEGGIIYDKKLSEIVEEKIEKQKSKGRKEIIIVKPNQTSLVKIYLDSLNLPKKGFVYYEDLGYKKIAELKPNLLNKSYWVICTHKFGVNTNPPQLKYNKEVLKDYLNHIIITNNWGLLEYMDKETYTIPLKFNKEVYNYDVVFASSMGADVLREYIHQKLGNLKNPMELERIENLIMKDKRRVVEWVEMFSDMYRYDFEEVVEYMRNNSAVTYNKLIKMLALKESPKKSTKKNPTWSDLFRKLINTKGEAYMNAVLKNGISDIIALKEGKKEIKSMNKNFIMKYIKEVDSLDILLLSNIMEVRGLEKRLVMLDMYMKTPTTELIREGGRMKWVV